MNNPINRTTVQTANNTYKIFSKNNPLFYKKHDSTYESIDLAFKETSSSIGEIELCDKNVFSVGIRKDKNPNKIVGIRPDNNQHLGDQQLEFSIKSVNLDNEEIAFDSVNDFSLQLRPNKLLQLVKVNKRFKTFKIEYDIHTKGLPINNVKVANTSQINNYSVDVKELNVDSGMSIISNYTNYENEDRTGKHFDIFVGKINDEFIATGEYSASDEFGDEDLSGYTMFNDLYPNGGSAYLKDCIVLYCKSYDIDNIENIFVNNMCEQYGLDVIWEDGVNGQYFTKDGKKVASYYSHNGQFFMFINTSKIPVRVKDLFKRKSFESTSYMMLSLDSFTAFINEIFSVEADIEIGLNHYKEIEGEFSFKINKESFRIKKPVLFDKDLNAIICKTGHTLRKIDNDLYRYTKYMDIESVLDVVKNVEYIDVNLSVTQDEGRPQYTISSSISSSSAWTSGNWDSMRNTGSSYTADQADSLLGVGDFGIRSITGYNASETTSNGTTTYKWENFQTNYTFDTSSITGTVTDAELNLKGNRVGTSFLRMMKGFDTAWNGWYETGNPPSEWDGNTAGVIEYGDSPVTVTTGSAQWFTSNGNSTCKSDVENNSEVILFLMDERIYDDNWAGGTWAVQEHTIRAYETDGTSANAPYLEVTVEVSATDNAIFFGTNF